MCFFASLLIDFVYLHGLSSSFSGSYKLKKYYRQGSKTGAGGARPSFARTVIIVPSIVNMFILGE